eukprot:scaffold14.g1158.t1
MSVQAGGKIILYDLHDQLVPYEQAWHWQKQLVEVVHELTSASHAFSSSSSSSNGIGSTTSGGGGADVVGAALLLQHPPVYTLGAGATERHLKFDPDRPPLPLYRTERGGEVTYHGPGQLVLYPILCLRAPPLCPDLHWYLRALEEVVIRALAEVSGLEGSREEGLTGVWVQGQKVAAIGVRASRWVAYHGLALNVTTDLGPFSGIVPCGIAGRPVASVRSLLDALEAQQRAQQPGEAAHPEEGRRPEDGAAAQQAGGEQQQQQQQCSRQHEQEDTQLLDEYAHGLMAAVQEVFGVGLEVLAGAEAVAQLDGLLSVAAPAAATR